MHGHLVITQWPHTTLSLLFKGAISRSAIKYEHFPGWVIKLGFPKGESQRFGAFCSFQYFKSLNYSHLMNYPNFVQRVLKT